MKLKRMSPKEMMDFAYEYLEKDIDEYGKVRANRISK